MCLKNKIEKRSFTRTRLINALDKVCQITCNYIDLPHASPETYRFKVEKLQINIVATNRSCPDFHQSMSCTHLASDSFLHIDLA